MKIFILRFAKFTWLLVFFINAIFYYSPSNLFADTTTSKVKNPFAQTKKENDLKSPQTDSIPLDKKANSGKEKPNLNPYNSTILNIYTSSDSTDRSIGIGDRILIKVDSLNPDIADKKVILFINNIPVKQLVHTYINVSRNELFFDLAFNDSTKKFWNEHLSAYKANDLPLVISCGVENYPSFGILESPNTKLKFTAYKLLYFWIFLVIECLIILSLVYFITRKNLLSNPIVKNCENLKKLYSDEEFKKIIAEFDPKKLPYSLGTTQIVFWFVIIVSAFLYLLLLTQNSPPFNSTVLALLGISTATALSNSFINSNRQFDISSMVNDYLEKKETLTGKIKTLKEYIDAPVDLTLVENKKIEKIESETKLKILEGEIQDLAQTIIVQPKKSFLIDLVSDSSGISFARFQIAAWTLVLGVVFIFKVWNTMTMPDLDPTLLALMGISSGTFLTFKFPENKIKA